MRSQNVIPSLFLDFMQMQQFAKNPLVFAEGKGIRLTDSEGKRYIDGLSGVFVTSLGHGNKPVIEAMSEQLKRLAFRSEEHTSELQSPCNLVCRLLLEKKKNNS